MNNEFLEWLGYFISFSIVVLLPLAVWKVVDLLILFWSWV